MGNFFLHGNYSNTETFDGKKAIIFSKAVAVRVCLYIFTPKHFYLLNAEDISALAVSLYPA